jgi:hypothetical protein
MKLLINHVKQTKERYQITINAMPSVLKNDIVITARKVTKFSLNNY